MFTVYLIDLKNKIFCNFNKINMFIIKISLILLKSYFLLFFLRTQREGRERGAEARPGRRRGGEEEGKKEGRSREAGLGRRVACLQSHLPTWTVRPRLPSSHWLPSRSVPLQYLGVPLHKGWPWRVGAGSSSVVTKHRHKGRKHQGRSPGSQSPVPPGGTALGSSLGKDSYSCLVFPS